MPLTFAHTVTPERVRWLWPGYIPAGKVTVLDGDPGLGKSTIMIDLAARLSMGGQLPNGKQHPPMGSILLMGEDGAADTIVPRLINAGADLERIGIRDTYENDKGNEIPPGFPSDLPKLKEDIIAARAGMVVIDPIMSYLDPDINSNNDQQVRRALMPLAQLAEETGCAIVLLRHLNKSQSGSALYRGGGSIGFVGVARSALIVVRDPDLPERVILASNKTNLGPPPPSLNYKLIGCENGAACVEWQGHNAHTAETLVQATQGGQEGRSALREAEDFLRDVLEGGPLLVNSLKKQAREAGIADATLQRAKVSLGVTSQKARTQDGQYTWMLPPKGKVVVPDEGDQPQGLSTLITLNTFHTQSEGDQDDQGDQRDQWYEGMITFENCPIAGKSGRGYECAVCGAAIYGIEGKPLLCPKHRDQLHVLNLTAD